MVACYSSLIGRIASVAFAFVVTAALVPAETLAIDEAVASSESGLAILPGSFTLTGPEARQIVLVELEREGTFVGQATGEIVLESSAPDVVAIEDGFAVPVGNGHATIRAMVDGRSATAEVTVEAMDEPFRWSFRNHVESVLAKAGCSSGACHGALAGKNGFKISLRGYDPDGDFWAITREARGRRIVPGDPGRSLFLLKPTSAVPHKGGMRFRPLSRDYRVLAEWIAAGTPPPADDDPRLDHLEILPPAAVLAPGNEQQFVIRAHFTDGHIEDVSNWAKYTSTNESVAAVDEQGLVHVMGHGEGAVTAWYLSQVVVATVASPYESAIDAQVYAKAGARNFVDDVILDKLASLNVAPSPPASDAEFLRRVFVDTIGVLPTAEEARGFLADDAPDKRDALIDSLLARPEFVDYWAYKWSDLFLVNGQKLPGPAMWSYYTWLRNHVEANTPWDEVVRDLLTASGSTLENGATNFYILHEDPRDLAETTTVAFLGMSINCARCHNHPLEKWTNDQYYAMANLFARVRTKNGPASASTVFAASSGDLVQPLTGHPRSPAPLDAEPISIDSPDDRRVVLADWLTSPENRYFSRSITNRVWASYMGVGLVENVDDMRQTNPASNEELLGALAGYLVDHDYDLKALMRLILQSAAYQRSSAPTPENIDDQRFYSHYYPRRLMAEVMLDAMSQVTGSPTEFKGFPAGWRSLQLPDASVESYFLQTFGRPERIITCDCERSDEPSMVQVLHISNGDSLNQKLSDKKNRLTELLDAGTNPEEVVDEVYLSALSRFPRDEERTRLSTLLAKAKEGDRRQVLEDLYWSVLSSTEFLFNH